MRPVSTIGGGRFSMQSGSEFYSQFRLRFVRQPHFFLVGRRCCTPERKIYLHGWVFGGKGGQSWEAESSVARKQILPPPNPPPPPPPPIISGQRFFNFSGTMSVNESLQHLARRTGREERPLFHPQVGPLSPSLSLSLSLTVLQLWACKLAFSPSSAAKLHYGALCINLPTL